MKRLILFLLFLPALTALAQQNPALNLEDPKMDPYLRQRKPALLTIRLNNLPDTVKHVDVKCSLVQLGVGLQTSIHSQTDANGVLEIILEQNLPYQQIWLSAGDYLYAGIYVNSGLTVTVDARKVPKDGAYMIGEGVTYSGADGAFNTVMNRKVLFRKKEHEALITGFRDIWQGRRNYSEAAFFAKADSIHRKLTAIDDDFLATNSDYAWAIRNKTESEFLGNICVAYWGEAMPDRFFSAVKQHQPYFASNEDALFLKYLATYSWYLKTGSKAATLEGALARVDSLYSPGKADLLKVEMLEMTKDSFAKSFPTIVSSIRTGWLKHIAVVELEKATSNQKRIDGLLAQSTAATDANIGTPLAKLPFDASLYRLDRVKSVDDFIRSLKAHAGKKAIVIDFWATWCSPCLSDMPYSKKLHEANADLPIEYVYICTTGGSSEQLWKTKVADMQLPGTHILVDDKLVTELKNAFRANTGFPAYVVIDAAGKAQPAAITRMHELTRESLKKACGLR